MTATAAPGPLEASYDTTGTSEDYEESEGEVDAAADRSAALVAEMVGSSWTDPAVRKAVIEAISDANAHAQGWDADDVYSGTAFTDDGE